MKFQLIIYNIFIQLYRVGISFFSLWNAKAKLRTVGVKKTLSSIEKEMKEWKEKNSDKKNTYWVHCASLGEFEQGRPVMEALKYKDSSCRIIITFFSPSGYENKKNYSYADKIFYLPDDIKHNAKFLIENIKPTKVFFIKYEFWFHYINEIKKKNIPLYLISARFRKEQMFFKWYGSFHRYMLSCFTHIFLQDTTSASLLKNINVKNYTVCGDTRYDRCFQFAKENKKTDIYNEFYNNNFIICGGSTWSEEENLLQKINNEEGIKFIIAPHDISRSEKVLEQFSNSVLLTDFLISPEKYNKKKCIVVNTIGHLSSLYALSDVAFVGGGFSGQLHNILEPAAFGNVIFFGPKTEKFPEADELVNENGAEKIYNEKDFSEKILHLKNDINLLKEKSAASKSFVEKRIGATEIIFKILAADF